MQAASKLAQNVPSALFVLFIGPWSDKFGRRKLLIVAPIVGFVYLSLFYLLNVIFYEELNADFLLLESLQVRYLDIIKQIN